MEKQKVPVIFKIGSILSLFLLWEIINILLAVIFGLGLIFSFVVITIFVLLIFSIIGNWKGERWSSFFNGLISLGLIILTYGFLVGNSHTYYMADYFVISYNITLSIICFFVFLKSFIKPKII